jgi:hypothetical protein
VGQALITDRQIFEGIQNCRYLGTLIDSKNEISEEIKSGTTAGNRHIFRSRAMSKRVKIQIHRTMVKPVVIYVREM